MMIIGPLTRGREKFRKVFFFLFLLFLSNLQHLREARKLCLPGPKTLRLLLYDLLLAVLATFDSIREQRLTARWTFNAGRKVALRLAKAKFPL